MQLIKVRFLRDGNPMGRPYTYESHETVKIGDIVQINSSARGIVVDIDILEEEVESFKASIKCIIGKVAEDEPRENQ